MSNIVDTLICIPFGAVLRYIYYIVKSYGFAIIIFTIVTKAIFFPLALKSKRSMMGMQRLSPKLTELQKKYGNDKEGYNKAAGELFQSEGVSPAGGCLPTLITFPIMIGLYYVIQRPLSFFFGLASEQIVSIAKLLGETIPKSSSQFQMMEISLASKAMENFDKVQPIAQKLFMVNFNFCGIPLSQTPKISQLSILWIIPILSGITAFVSNKVMMKAQEKMNGGNQTLGAGTNSMMMMLLPLMSVWFGFILPAGVGIYWITSNVVTMLQEVLITEHLVKEENKKQGLIQAEKAAREAAKKEIEAERRSEQLTSAKNNEHKKQSGSKSKNNKKKS